MRHLPSLSIAWIAATILSICLPPAADAVVVNLQASKDNTLYELVSGVTSNGAGSYMFTGRTSGSVNRRAVIHFDIAAAIPPGAVINSVTLQMRASRVKNNTPRATKLHRLLADWGEGTSDAGQQEGKGATPTTGDATWLHTFYPGSLWATPGGDFSGVATDSVFVAGTGIYTWTGASLVTDVQSWLDSPSSNFGWLIRGDESLDETAKRFDSSENGTVANRPVLSVDYTPVVPTGACCHDGTCEELTAAACAAVSGTYEGDGTTCTPNPCPPAGAVTVNLSANQDNTLYEDPTGSLSNGAGTKLIVSTNASDLIRRSVVRFDVSSIPAGATIWAASLILYNAETGTNTTDVTVHRATSGWGEGTSVAGGNEDAGAPATTDDATWVHRFYPSLNWTTAGGDFEATASATTSVANDASYSWSSTGTVADVQTWVDNPTLNYGWVVRGNETAGGSALKRFESRQSAADPGRLPRLEVIYVPPAPPATGACCFDSGTCDTLTAAQCLAQNGNYQGDNTACTTDLCPLVLEPFVDALPVPGAAVPVTGVPGGAASYVINIVEFEQQLHRDLPPTRVWGYDSLYPGPTIEASVDEPVTVTWVNDIRDENGVLRTAHYLPVDLCMHGPDELGPTPRTVAHLHGGHVEAAYDGYPENYILPGQQQTYIYENHQLPGTLWYHDHALGITRLNVMMGLAGFYLLRDPFEQALGLPSGSHEIGMAIQDRAFNPDGSLVYPAAWEEHFHGDVILVNGKVWPYLNVDQGKYRFRWLNGSNSRSYTLRLSNGAPFHMIGAEGGLLPAPIQVDSLTITPGERRDVIVDFAPYAPGTEIILKNSAPMMFPGTPGEGVIPDVMKFVVQGQPGHTDPLPVTLRPVVEIPESLSVADRDFELMKMSDPCAGSMWTINGLRFDDITERPIINTTEIWRFINPTGVVHPMHMHLVMFQVLDVTPFTMIGDSLAAGTPQEPDPTLRGWKDTVPVYPNQMVRVIATFEDYLGKFPYHCHILEHEDHEMMRQFEVVIDSTLVGVGDAPRVLSLKQSYPNPFNPSTRIDFEVPQQARTRLEVYDVGGRRVATLIDGVLPAGSKSMTWDGRNSKGERVASGVYFYRLSVSGHRSLVRKMVLLK